MGCWTAMKGSSALRHPMIAKQLDLTFVALVDGRMRRSVGKDQPIDAKVPSNER